MQHCALPVGHFWQNYLTFFGGRGGSGWYRVIGLGGGGNWRPSFGEGRSRGCHQMRGR